MRSPRRRLLGLVPRGAKETAESHPNLHDLPPGLIEIICSLLAVRDLKNHQPLNTIILPSIFRSKTIDVWPFKQNREWLELISTKPEVVARIECVRYHCTELDPAWQTSHKSHTCSGIASKDLMRKLHHRLADAFDEEEEFYKTVQFATFNTFDGFHTSFPNVNALYFVAGASQLHRGNPLSFEEENDCWLGLLHTRYVEERSLKFMTSARLTLFCGRPTVENLVASLSFVLASAAEHRIQIQHISIEGMQWGKHSSNKAPSTWLFPTIDAIRSLEFFNMGLPTSVPGCNKFRTALGPYNSLAKLRQYREPKRVGFDATINWFVENTISFILRTLVISKTEFTMGQFVDMLQFRRYSLKSVEFQDIRFVLGDFLWFLDRLRRTKIPSFKFSGKIHVPGERSAFDVKAEGQCANSAILKGPHTWCLKSLIENYASNKGDLLAQKSVYELEDADADSDDDDWKDSYDYRDFDVSGKWHDYEDAREIEFRDFLRSNEDGCWKRDIRKYRQQDTTPPKLTECTGLANDFPMDFLNEAPGAA